MLLTTFALLAWTSAATAPDDTPPPAAAAANADAPAAMTAEQQALAMRFAAIKFQTGDVPLPSSVATLHLPDGYRYVNPDDTTFIVEKVWGNPAGVAAGNDGLILPLGQTLEGDSDWAIVISFHNDGYVSDDDADDIDYDDLLADMKKASVDESAEREKAGFGKMLLTGWALPPRYDSVRKVMYWAKEFDIGGPEQSLNYDVRVLGRGGVLSLVAIASAARKAEIDKLTPQIVSLVTFNKGHTYAEYNPDTDKKADYTLAGLIVGGAVAAKLLAKGGLFVVLAKFGKLLLVPFVAASAWVKKKLGRT
jgi:uncharacterized membrane-anchored protein